MSLASNTEKATPLAQTDSKTLRFFGGKISLLRDY